MLSYAPWLIWLLPAIGFVVTPLFARVNTKFSNYVAVTSIGLSFFFSISMIPDILSGNIIEQHLILTPFEISVLIDPLNIIMSCVVSCIGFIVTLFSVEYMRSEPSIVRFWCLIQGFMAGYMMTVISGNLFLTFIGWQILSLCCSGLISFWYRDTQKAYAGLKTFLFLRVGDVLLLIAIKIIKDYAGTLNIIELQQSLTWLTLLSQSGLLPIVMFSLLGGVMIKAAQFPLHKWLGDRLVTSPSCFNALTGCLVGPYLLARVLPIFHSAYTAGVGELGFFFSAMAWIGVVTALLTALTATAQKNIFRVLAYSVSSIIGYTIAAFGLGGLMSDFRLGYLAGTFFLLVNFFITGLLLLATASIKYMSGTDDLIKNSGFASKVARRAMQVGVLSMIGIPPLSGFWCFNWIQRVALDFIGEAGRNGQILSVVSAYGLYALLIITMGITAFYNLRMIGFFYGKEIRRFKKRELRKFPSLMQYSLTVMLVITIIMTILALPIIPVFNSFLFPMQNKIPLANIFAIIEYIIPSINTVLSISVLVIFMYPAYQLHIAHRFDVIKLMTKHQHVKKMQLFLNKAKHGIIMLGNTALNRIEKDLDSLNHLIANQVVTFAEAAHHHLEQNIDSLNHLIAERVASLSNRARLVHTGVISYNMSAVLISIFVVITILLLFGGFT